MLFVRVFFVVIVGGALCALGYAVWLTFEPLDAPPLEPEAAAPAITTTGARIPATAATPTPDTAPQVPAAASGLDDAQHADPVLDQLRKPIQAARAVTDDAREVVRRARRVKRDIEAVLPDTEELTLENAWKTAKEAGVGLVDGAGEDPALPILEARGRIHPSGAPAPAGGGPPGTARQPGIDWYRGGGTHD